MTGIYRESIGFFLASLPTLLVFAVVIESANWFLQAAWMRLALDFVALTIIAYAFHRHFLFGEPLRFRQPAPSAAPPFKFGQFFVVSMVLYVVTIGLFVVWLYTVAGDTMPGFGYWPLYLVILGLFGTALPATVVQDRSYRLTQGLRAGTETVLKLLLGPGLVGTGTFVLVVTGNQLLRNIPDDSLVHLAFAVIGTTIYFLSTILAVAVLCEMYHKTRPAP